MNPSFAARVARCSVWTVCFGLIVGSVQTGLAGPDDFTIRPAQQIHPWQDDAALHDVQFIGRKAGWAVGDHGTIWKTSDGGATWERLPISYQGSLRSICFLSKRVEGNLVGTSQIAWVAGRETQPYTKIGTGVVLKTTDGGKSWQTLGQGQNLPPLNYVRFFGGTEGVAVGEATTEFPTGVLFTQDGGETWQPAPGERTAGWHSASFTDFNDGIAVGPRERISLVAGTNVARPRADSASLRSIRAVSVTEDLTGWAVGDGALVMMTLNGGVSWKPLLQPFPPELSRYADFAAVATHGESLWIAGTPGGRIWRSVDGGQNWLNSPTGVTTPIHALYFSSHNDGVAVGAFGTILRTIDGGITWQTARDGSRRAAVLSFHSGDRHIPFGMLTKYGGDQGYRCVSLVVPRRDLSPNDDLAIERQLEDAVKAVGGSSARAEWRLPIALPDVDRQLNQLTAEWQQHTEGKLVDVVISNLTAAIRTWRPSVVVVEDPAPNDAAGVLVRDAVLRAIKEAGDPTKQIAQQELTGLSAWKVRKIFRKVAGETRAGITIDPYDVLPRLGTTVESAASSGRSRLIGRIALTPEPEPFVPLDSDDDRFILAAQREFWTDLSIAPGSDARRPQLPLDEQKYEQQREIAIRQRNFRGIAKQYAKQPMKASQLLAEIRGVVQGMPRHQAALQIAHLANDYRLRSQWDLAEATFIDLISQYPDQPVAAESMLWLLHLWSSDEMAWQRSRNVRITAQKETTNRRLITGRMEQLLKVSHRPLDDPLKVARQLSVNPLDELLTTQLTPSQNSNSWQTATITFWQQQALQMARVISRKIPGAWQTQEVLWPVASVLRREGHGQVADSIYRKHVTTDLNDPVSRLASGELFMTQPVDEAPTHIGFCTWATIRPHLDGVLGDECWRDAREFRLTTGRDDEDPLTTSYPFVMTAWDDQFLYFAASFPREPGAPSDSPQYDGRTHDADLSGFDRVTFRIDTDRDYATSYEITIDQRGHVAESCWEDTTWNPKMAVAVDGDESRWRLEMAIPFGELASRAPARKSSWALSIGRTIPNTGRQSWIHPHAGKSTPVSFGLIRFQ